MKPAPFDLHRPDRLEDALALLARHGEAARVLAGGQTLVPMMNLRVATPALLVDLALIPELSDVALRDGRLVLGAMLRQAALLRHPLVAAHAPLLRAAAAHVGHVQTRSRGTLGGSVAHADPAAELPAALLALGATMLVQGPSGPRRIAAEDFFLGALTTALCPAEILCAIEVPAAPPGSRVAFCEVSRRHGDFAIVAAAAQRNGATGRLALALGGLLPRPHACAGLAAALAAGPLPDLPAAIAAELAPLTPLDDVFASAAYRRRIAAALLEDVIAEVMADA